MAANYKAGTITSPTSTGNAAFTGVGFVPKALILTFEKQTASGSGVDFLHSTGFATSSSSRRAVGAVYLDNVAGGTVNMGRVQSNAHILYAYNTTAASLSAFVVADLVSFDADGFTLNFSTVQASGYIVNYVAFGGDDITNVAIKSIQAPASTGSVAYTGVGFQPDFLFTMTNSDTSAGPGTSHNSGARVGIGFGTSGAHKALMGVGDETAGKFHGKAQKTDIMLSVDAVAGTIQMEATLTSLDADGFTWNWVATSTNRRVEVLCFKGGQYKVGVFNQATANGNQSVTGVGFTPLGIMFASACGVASTSVISNNDFSMGAASSSSSRWATWFGSSGDPTVVDHYEDTSNVIRMLTEGTPTALTTADYVSNDADGFTINNTATDATAREIIYMAFGSNAVVGGQAANAFMTTNTEFWG